MVTVSYHARQQMDRLSPQERRELEHMLASSDRQTESAQSSDKYVSRLGDDKRVLWSKDASGDIVILSVVTK